MAVAGDITEITYNHPDLGTGSFAPKAAEDSTYDKGGYRANDDANGVDGKGNMITSLNRVRWLFETSIAWNMNDPDAQEIEKLNALAASPKEATWTFANVNGVIYSGKGRPVGDIQGNGNAGTIALKVAGGGELKIVN